MTDMKIMTLIGAGALLIATAYSSLRNTSNPPTMNTDSTSNTTATESSDGWISLFDGQTLNGWRTYQNKPSEAWHVQDGVLHCTGNETDKSDLQVDLITAEQYENFDFSIDWKISPKG